MRMLASQFPKCVNVHFRKKEFEKAKELFYKWYELVKEKLPSKYREAILANAEQEFELFMNQVLKASKS
jgi:hypothetical protein